MNYGHRAPLARRAAMQGLQAQAAVAAGGARHGVAAVYAL
jgi:hypothetical protein